VRTIHDHTARGGKAQAGGGLSDIVRQLLEIEAEQAGGTVIDLANDSEPAAPATSRPSLPRGWRRRRHPVLIGWPGRGGLMLEVWCPWCQVFHIHSRGNGHRAAHCTDGPLRKSGYVVAEVRP
jgi:hypothetical protein